MKTYVFDISGTHCNSCKALIEDILGERTDVRNAQLDLKGQTLGLESDIPEAELVNALNGEFASFGYVVSAKNPDKN